VSLDRYGRLLKPDACPYHGARKDADCDCFVNPKPHGLTTFSKIRLNVTSLRVDGNDDLKQNKNTDNKSINVKCIKNNSASDEHLIGSIRIILTLYYLSPTQVMTLVSLARYEVTTWWATVRRATVTAQPIALRADLVLIYWAPHCGCRPTPVGPVTVTGLPFGSIDWR